MSRTEKALKNIMFGYAASGINYILTFIARTVFLYVLNKDFLGVEGLFTNVLGLLSLADLGIGTALNYCLYAPVASGDKEKTKALLAFYRKAYLLIAVAIACLGMMLFPFLNFLVKDPGNVGDIRLYYVIYLLNVVSGYFMTYKFSYLNALQKTYVVSKINIATSCIVVSIQIIVLLVYRSFLFYLLVSLIINLLQKVFIDIYLNCKYPIFKEKSRKLNKDELSIVTRKMKALFVHKFAEVCVYQTDNLIISSMVSIGMVGLISNYTMFTTGVGNLLYNAFNSVMPSLGNMVATETREDSLKVFKKYNFASFWLYGLFSVMLVSLLPSFIQLWIGADKLVDNFSFILIMVNFYLLGQRIAFLNYKTVFGLFEDDKYVAIAVAIMNLSISIIGVKIFGLCGVYIGTVITGLYQSIRRPIIGYKKMTGESVKNYFCIWGKYLFIVMLTGMIWYVLIQLLRQYMTLVLWIVCLFGIFITTNLVWMAIFRKSEELKYFVQLIKKIIREVIHNDKKTKSL